jgi:membrane AbrB-like protein
MGATIMKPAHPILDFLRQDQRSPLLLWSLTYLIAIASAAIAQLLHTPLPWMLGPLFVLALLGSLGLPLQAPPLGRSMGQWSLGIAIGLYFSPSAVANIRHDLPFIAIACVVSTILLAFGTWMLWRFFHIPLRTAFFASALGGASEMTVLAERHEQRADLVAAAHSLRLLLILAIIPGVFQIYGVPGNLDFQSLHLPISYSGMGLLLLCSSIGIAGFHFLRLPNAFLLGPLAVSAILTACGVEWTTWPKALSNAGQLLIGVGLGIRFTREFVIHAKKLAIGVTIYTLLACIISVLFSLAIAGPSGLDIESLILSTVPGGMSEMGITAKNFHLNVPAVAVFHVLRMAFVILSAELFFHQVLGRLERKFDLHIDSPR